MYTILISDDNTAIATVRQRIMQRSKLVDQFHVLTPRMYGEHDMIDFTCNMEYMLPISKKYKSEILKQSDELYEAEFVEFKVPFDTALTSEHGDIEVQFTFTYSEMDENGEITQYVRKTDVCPITIIPIAAWSDVIPDEALNAVDQKILQLTELVNELNDMADVYNKTKADNIALNEDGDVQLKAMGEFVGDPVSVAIPETEDDQDEEHDGVIDLNYKYRQVTI